MLLKARLPGFLLLKEQKQLRHWQTRMLAIYVYASKGHIFPLIAERGGVLRRAGHTEAAL